MDTITLRPINLSDIFRVWRWRNENRKFFIYSDYIPFIKHITWFISWLWSNSFSSDKNMFIIYYLTFPVGLIGIDIEKGGWQGTLQRVILGNKNCARRGVMGVALEKVIQMFPLHLYKLDVLRDNTVAMDFYKKHGFKIDEENSNQQVYRMKRYESD